MTPSPTSSKEHGLTWGDGHNDLTLGHPGHLDKHRQAPPALYAALSCTLRTPPQWASAVRTTVVLGSGASSSQMSLVFSLPLYSEGAAPVHTPSFMLISQGDFDMPPRVGEFVPYPRTLVGL